MLGGNDQEQLGNATVVTYHSTVPVAVTGLGSGVTAISAGDSHTCAVLTTGGVKCWGSNYYGQLGNGTTTDSNVPLQVTGLTGGVAAISAGYHHTCAVLTTGGVKCWGSGYRGELGNGTGTESSVPVAVTGLGGSVASVSVGGTTSCALLTTGAVKCWGGNYFGQLGNGTTTDSKVPVAVTGLGSGVTSISSSGAHTCAVLANGVVKCWGYNSAGELGNGTTTDSSVPVAVIGLGGAATPARVRPRPHPATPGTSAPPTGAAAQRINRPPVPD